jgi:hypothetical protein
MFQLRVLSSFTTPLSTAFRIWKAGGGGLKHHPPWWQHVLALGASDKYKDSRY